MTPPTKANPKPAQAALRMTMTGRVQGIGLRPTIARLAQQLSLCGYVGNTQEGVELHVEGPLAVVDRFQSELQSHLPQFAVITSCRKLVVEAEGFTNFGIRSIGSSQTQLRHSLDSDSADHKAFALTARVPTDVGVCADCQADIQDEANRRYQYPFASCTHCGPRYSIIERMPYERSDTVMNAFPMCKLCLKEYESAGNRRFHAQTNACSECGPQVWLRDAKDQIVAHQDDAIQAAAATILNGGILAMRGLGGYQLLVDATSQSAVMNLRHKKERVDKPLAVMVASLSEAEEFAQLDPVEQQTLCSPANPIVVLQSREESGLAQSISCRLNTVGLMLPTTPLHRLLLESVKRPLVCTSGNRDGEPLVFTTTAAFDQLEKIADAWLEHDRPIRRPIDDSVVRVISDRPVAIRLGRGYSPLSLALETDETMVATGGHQKVAVAISNGAQSILAPHLGDMDTITARQRYIEQQHELSKLYGIESSSLVCDQHPEYYTTDWAEKQADLQSCPVLKIQHHHAHVAAAMLEHNWLDRQVLGVAFDGTGYGVDGTIWGGEFLLATSSSFERVGHLRPVPLVGGELAIRQPWRVAISLVNDAVGESVGEAAAMKLGFQVSGIEQFLRLLRKPALSSLTTSAGRLFDGMAAIILGIEQSQFEGQAAILLESACDLSAVGQYDLTIDHSHPRQLDWRPLVRQVLLDRENGVSTGTMAMRFHRGLAAAIVEFCSDYPTLPVAPGGGVFQNKVLVELLADGFKATGQPLGLPGLIPPNDGGLAAGQLAIAASQMRLVRCQPPSEANAHRINSFLHSKAD